MSLSQSKRILRTGTHLFHEEARICYAALGPRGIFYSSTSWAFGHPAEITVPVEGIKHPVHIRMRTSDAGVFEDALVKKEYEYPVSFLPRTIIDVGANCGMTTIFYANRYPNATIVAVEPEESNYSALIKNTQSYANVVPLHAALWNSDGQVE